MSTTRKDSLNLILGNPFPLITNEALDPAETHRFIDVFLKHGYNQIDTARAYGSGEKNFGVAKWFERPLLLDTKVRSFEDGAHAPSSIHASVQTSLELLGVPKVNILYLHSPDRATPFLDTLRALNDLHQAGKYAQLGLSNYTAAEVKEIVDICDKEGFVRPTVYQGNYSVLVRSGEGELFPLLRKEKIAFYAWSPLAGGFLTGKYTKADQKSLNESTHFTGPYGSIFQQMFFRDAFFGVVDDYLAFAKSHNLTPTELALRWLAHHSQLDKKYDDAIILGASRPEQFENNIIDVERGPLPADAAAFIDSLWQRVKADAPAYHY